MCLQGTLSFDVHRIFFIERPYHVGNTGSPSITAVKQRWAWLLFGLVTAWEHHVLLALNLHSVYRDSLHEGKAASVWR